MSSFVDYDNLIESVASWLARSDLTNQIKDFIWLAECDIQRTIQFRDPQDLIHKGSTTEGQEWIQLPDDYGSGGHLRWSDDALPAFEVASISVVDRTQRETLRALAGTVFRVGYVWGNRIYIGPAPGAVDFELFYHAGVVHLSSENPTNNILRQYPDTLLYGALTTSAPFIGSDERVQVWAQFYENAKEETRKAEWRARNSHGQLRMRPDIQVF